MSISQRRYGLLISGSTFFPNRLEKAGNVEPTTIRTSVEFRRRLSRLCAVTLHPYTQHDLWLARLLSHTTRWRK